MLFYTIGNPSNPTILFFHAMGVTGKSSTPVAQHLSNSFYCIMPSSTVYCPGQEYKNKLDEIQQIQEFLKEKDIQEIELVVASSIGADLALTFLTNSKTPIKYVFFDGGQFAQINKTTRKIMVPFLYIAIKSLYWTKGKTLKKILWCDDEQIKPYFIEASQNMTYKNLKRQLQDSLEDKPFPTLPKDLQKHIFFEFGNKEEHFKYRENVMKAYPFGQFPIFDGCNHMQYQIKEPQGFAKMLEFIIRHNKLPNLPFISFH